MVTLSRNIFTRAGMGKSAGMRHIPSHPNRDAGQRLSAGEPVDVTATDCFQCGASLTPTEAGER